MDIILNQPYRALKRLLLILMTVTLSACGGGGDGGSDDNLDVTLSIADAQVLDSATSVEVAVSLSQASTQSISVNYATADGTALAGQDYTAVTGTLTIPAGTVTLNIDVPLIETRDTTTTKTFLINLSSPSNATIADAQAQLSLLDAIHSAMFNNPTYTSTWPVTGVFSNALTCASCHTGTAAVTPTIMMYNGTDVSPAAQWKHSVMAHSLNDPYYNAVVEEEVHIFPDKQVFIEDTCLRCHAPMASTHAHQTLTNLVDDPLNLSPDGAGYPFATAMNASHAREGVSCTSCHQIQDPSSSDPTIKADPSTDPVLLSSMSGHYTIKSEADNAGAAPSIFGPFQIPVGQAMQNQTQYIPAYAAHIHESAMCATCHNLYTPTLDLDGNPHFVDNKIAQFPEQTPYWDWLNSKFSDATTGKTCQACHMAQPEPGYTTPITTRPTSITARPDLAKDNADSVFSVHEFVGGNGYLLGLLKTYMTELGIADKTTAAGFDQKIAQTQSMLESAASLNVTSNLVGNTLSVPVTITNLTGHKLPTSFPSRRMWVHFKVTDANQAVVFESGKADAKGLITKDAQFSGYECMKIHKTDGFDSLTAGCYEQHHDVITDATQVQIYEPVLGDLNGDITHVLLHADTYLKDNRIPPIGWTLANRHPNPVTPGQFDDDITGLASSDTNFATGKDGAGSDGKDTITYQVDTTGATAPFKIEVELLYQSIRPSFVYGMHADDVEHEGIEGDSFVRRFKYMYENTPPTPTVLATYTSP